MAIDWGRAAYMMEFPSTAAYEAEKLRGLNVPAAPSAPAVPVSEPTLAAPSSAPAERSARTAPTVGRVAKHHRDAATVLADALDEAASDAERAALLAAASQDTRDQLNARLTYLRFQSGAGLPDPDAPFDELTHALDRATDDNARAAIFEAARRDPKRGPKFLSEWHWRRTATADDWRKRYLAMVDGDMI